MPDLYQNIIMRIGTQMGPGGLASLKAGSDMVLGLSRVLVNIISTLDKYNDMLTGVDMGMINYARSASAGKIATFDLIAGFRSLKEAGITPTSEELKILSVRAADFADKTGRQANEVFNQMTSSISRGTSRAVKEFGVNVKDTGSLVGNQSAIMKAMTKDMENLTTEADDLSDAFMSFGDTLTMIATKAWGYATKGGGFNPIIQGISALDRALQGNSNAWTDWATSFDTIFTGVQLKWATLMGNAEDMMMLTDRLKKGGRVAFLQARIQQEEDELARMYEARATKQERATRVGEKKKSGGAKQSFTTEGEDVDALRRLGDSDYQAAVQEYAQLTGMDFQSLDDIIAAEKEYARIKGSGSGVELGDTSFWSDRMSAQQQRDFGGAAESVDQKLANMQAIEDQKAADFAAWLERWRAEQARQDDQLSFAEDWRAVWENSLNSVTAGTMTAQAAHDLLRGTWNATIDAAITGKKTFAQAVRTMVAEIGLAVAKEAGWQALMNAAFAVYSLAKRDYSAAAEYGAAALMFGALATTAGVAARAMQPKGKAEGSVASPSRSAAQYGTTYPAGGMSQQDKVQVNVYLEGEAQGVFRIVKTENESRARSGQSSFQAA